MYSPNRETGSIARYADFWFNKNYCSISLNNNTLTVFGDTFKILMEFPITEQLDTIDKIKAKIQTLINFQ